jgi:Ser/Thr protein kinase RdoA (MazF antagonist)
MTVAAIPCSRGWPDAAAARSGRGSRRSLADFWAGCTAISPLSRSLGHRIPFPRILEIPADPAWQRLGALDDPVLTGLIRRKLAEVRTAAGSAASGRPGVQLVHGDWHDGNILYQGGTVSGILDFDFAHPDLPLVDVAIATLIPQVKDSAQIAAGYFGARSPTEHELDLIATAQRARGLGHVAFFISRHADGDHGALDQIRLGVELLLRAEQRWPALRAAILSGTTG